MRGRGGTRWTQDVWDLLVGSDPGLLRLRLGVRAALAVGLVVAAMNLVAPQVGIPTIVAILLGGMIAMNGSFAASSRTPRDAAVTLAYFPLAAAAGVLTACLVAGHRLAELVTFVLVMIVAVFVRRYGARGFQYGMIAWLAYFFTMFVGFRLGQFWDVIAVVGTAGACVALAAIVLAPDRPTAAYAAARRAFDVRVRGLADAARDALTGAVPPERTERLLHAKGFRVVEAALIVDGYLSATGGSEQQVRRAAAIRHGLLEVELAAEELAAAATDLALMSDLPASLRSELVAALGALDGFRLRAARGHVAELARRTSDLVEELPTPVLRRVRDALRALQQLIDGLDHSSGDVAARAWVPPDVREFTPAVPLFLGNLPSTSPTAIAAIAATGDGATWWSRRSLNTRLCLQVAVAGSIAVFAGDLLSGKRYYWAVLACFLVLTGTFTTGEIAAKGAYRVLGTVAGLIAATITVHLTGHHDSAIIAVILVCVFLGLYFFRISYAVMAFAITTVMGQLYNVLHEFSDSLLLLRLAETVLGATVGIAVALVVLPVRTADVRATAIDAFLRDLRGLVDDVRQRLETGVRTSNLFLDARRLDGQLHQLAQLVLPAGGQTLLGLAGRRASRRLVPFTEAAYCARALAAAVAERPPHPPELVELINAEGRKLSRGTFPLLEQLSSVHASDGIEPVTATLSQVCEQLRRLRREVDRTTREARQRFEGPDPLTDDTLIRAQAAVDPGPGGAL